MNLGRAKQILCDKAQTTTVEKKAKKLYILVYDMALAATEQKKRKVSLDFLTYGRCFPTQYNKTFKLAIQLGIEYK